MPMIQWVDEINTNATPTITKDDVIYLTLLNEAAKLSHELERRATLEEVIG